jgi:hypothetical protein
MRRSPSWDRSLLVVLYDEHGGFFDHVPPPAGVPGPGRGERGFGFTQLGIRVPCLFIAPYAPKGGVWRPPLPGFADHTSLIASVLRRRGLPPLTARDAAATEVWGALSESKPRIDDLPTLEAIEAWREGQEAVDVHEFAGLLDPAALEGRSGREVAAAILATQPPPTVLERAPGELAATGVDVPFEQALVDLAERIIALPA